MAYRQAFIINLCIVSWCEVYTFDNFGMRNILYIQKTINISQSEKDLEVLQIASEKFDKETIKQIKQLSQNEKDFMLISMFSMLFQDNNEEDWTTSISPSDYKQLENIFERVI